MPAVDEIDIDEIIGSIEKLSVLKLVELTKAIQEKWGVSAAPIAVAAVAASGPAAEAAPAVEEKTSFDVILKEVGGKKIQVIKVVREVTALGLIEAKNLVEGAPQPVKQGVNKDEAEQVKAKLEAEGAVVEIQ
ncbi:MAG TPA: 50S ribosomal protein L7/L12 [Chthonomonadales bacterium]|nr:50S ribosomal protein L7/L12 [Chthonomonadales bacterium]